MIKVKSGADGEELSLFTVSFKKLMLKRSDVSIIGAQGQNVCGTFRTGSYC